MQIHALIVFIPIDNGHADPLEVQLEVPPLLTYARLFNIANKKCIKCGTFV